MMERNERIFIPHPSVKKRGDKWVLTMLGLSVAGWGVIYAIYKVLHR